MPGSAKILVDVSLPCPDFLMQPRRMSLISTLRFFLIICASILFGSALPFPFCGFFSSICVGMLFFVRWLGEFHRLLSFRFFHPSVIFLCPEGVTSIFIIEFHAYISLLLFFSSICV